jgi:DNA-binding transcriptional MerR regulator
LTNAEEVRALVPAGRSALTVERGGYRIEADSPRTSLLVLPVEYSHCLRAELATTGANPPGVMRANLAMTAILFSAIKMLPAPPRTASGRRVYSATDLRVLAETRTFVGENDFPVFRRRSRELGFSLDEIRALLRLGAPGKASCSEVKEIGAGTPPRASAASNSERVPEPRSRKIHSAVSRSGALTLRREAQG